MTMKHSFAAIVTSFFSFHIAVNTLDGSAGFNRSMAREMQGERVPLLAREREAPRLLSLIHISEPTRPY